MKRMKWSVDPEVRRVAPFGVVNLTTKTVEVTEEEVNKLTSALFILEQLLREAVDMIEIVQIRFEQGEVSTQWMACIRAVLTDNSPDSSKFNATACIEQGDLNPPKIATRVAIEIKHAFRAREYGASSVVTRLAAAVAAVEERLTRIP